jgi:hypothetical protein
MDNSDHIFLGRKDIKGGLYDLSTRETSAWAIASATTASHERAQTDNPSVSTMSASQPLKVGHGCACLGLKRVGAKRIILFSLHWTDFSSLNQERRKSLASQETTTRRGVFCSVLIEPKRQVRSLAQMYARPSCLQKLAG